MIFTTDDLLASIKRNAVVPSSQRKYSDDDFVALLNEELQLMLTGELMRLNEEFFITSVDVPLVANQSEYQFPSKAAGWRLRDIAWVDAIGNVFQNLPRVGFDYIDRMQFTASDHPNSIYVSDSSVKTVPPMGSSVNGSLRMSYERLQNTLVKSDECAQITNVATIGTDYQLTFVSLPIAYTSGIDVVSGTGPHGIIMENVIPVAGGATLTVPIAGFTRTPVIGDWAVKTGNTPIAHIPTEYNIILAQLVALRYSVASGDEKSVQTMSGSIQGNIQKLRERSLNRVKGAPVKVLPKNRIGNLMRGRMF